MRPWMVDGMVSKICADQDELQWGHGLAAVDGVLMIARVCVDC